MKVILSRKGFDNQYGGQPSPILPDGTLLSLPIPSKVEKTKYSEIYHEGKSYLDIIKELKNNPQIKDDYVCHLDPDIRFIKERNISNWQPLFGQANSALGHLEKQGIGFGDIFLFFGSFRATELVNNKLQYLKSAPEIHLIYGYFQVEKVYKSIFPKEFSYHPHAENHYVDHPQNAIFQATEKLSFIQNKRGADCLSYNDKLVLSKVGFSKSRWELPEIFKKITMSYHTEKSIKGDYFQSAAKGQEFVIQEGEMLIPWLKELIK